ncbi:D-glycerate dehydrogenase [Candidatus Peregrinibacteria bacterium]|nr:D-glycerate dehydrogenase [Candidatus Peregrinibacteria bacterium]
MASIYVTRRIPEKGLLMLKETFGDDAIEVNPDDRVLSREELLEKVQGRDAILSLLTDKMDSEVMDAAGSQCKVISNYAVGYNNINLKAATERNIMVTNTPGVLTNATADMAIALMFAVARRIPEGDRFMREKKYEGWAPMLLLGQQVTRKKLGIIGTGRIGSNIGRKMHKGFNMDILYFDRNVKEEFEKDTNATKVDLETLCKESDYISINLNYTPETHHLINENLLNLMKEEAILVNTARGQIIDEDALVQALKDKKIFGAGLDVYEKEPKMADGLEKLDNVVLAPHTGSATCEARTKMSEIAAQNIIDALNDKKPQFLVTQ